MKDIALHILDIAQNAIKAKADCIQIDIEDIDNNNLVIGIEDNGSGISKELLATVTDPYTTSRTTRKVGLGIPLLKQNAERTKGYINIISEIGKGTKVKAHFKKQHIDCLPLGDIAGVVALLVNANPHINFIYTHKAPKQSYVFKTTEIKKILGNVPINDPEIHQFIKTMINENINKIYQQETTNQTI